jgi:GNAT superfamily N-acetyltransferase
VSYPFSVEALTADHQRRSFRCGVEALDRYFTTQLTQDVRRKVASCFVAVRPPDRAVKGFYTISTASLPFRELPLDLSRRLPRYPRIPAVLVGRLAVDETCRGIGLGSTLLLNAIARAIRSEIASYAMLVEAKDDAARAFYEHHGFASLESIPNTLFLPLTEAARSLKNAGH